MDNKEKYYNSDTIDAKLAVISAQLGNQDIQREQMHETLKSIDIKMDDLNAKVAYTNGKVRKQEKILLVVGAVVGTLLIVNGSSFVQFIMTLTA